MTQYIDKDTLIEYVKFRYLEHQTGNQPIGCLDRMKEDKAILSYLNTIEVKDVDLEKEYDNYTKNILACDVQFEPQDKGEISDGYHTFNELYYYRMLYNAAFFNMLPKEWVHKSKKHHDGEECFGGGWFIVMANLPTGQISNHYELKDWNLFQIPEKEVADKWDGHTPQEAADRLHKYLLEKQGEQKSLNNDKYQTVPVKILDRLYESEKVLERLKQGERKSGDKIESKFKVGDWIIRNDNSINIDYSICKITKVTNGNYTIESVYGYKGYNTFETFEKDYHLWTIQDAKDGEVLSSGKIIVIFKHFEEPSYRQHIVAYVGLDAGGNIQITDDTWRLGIDKAKPATKEQRDILFQKMKEAGHEWDFENKELKKIEQKPAWTKEDEKMFSNINDCIKNLPIFYESIIINGEDKTSEQFICDVINWLKSLKDRVQL